MKRVLTIQDISCLGKCSMTVALPLISAMGAETVILPTALLSTHTGFPDFTCRDLSDQILPITAHWKKEAVSFDIIYTGYLGTEEEIETVTQVIEAFRTPRTMVLIDPAMGDNGHLYPAFDPHYAKKNASLCALGDVILPNITEACFLTGLPYRENCDEAYLKELLARLTALGAKTIILTGVSLREGKTGVMGYDTRTQEYFSYQNDRVPAAYHGTGDIFSSVVTGALANDIPWRDAVKIAADYTARTIEVTLKNPKKPWYGVDFESTIPLLVNTLQEYFPSPFPPHVV